MFVRKQYKLIDFDKCVFPHCNNGLHNNYKLFKLPRACYPKRHKQWLDIINNPLLMRYSTNYLSLMAGVCTDHFQSDAFCNAEKSRLRRFSFPERSNVQSNTANFYSNASSNCMNEMTNPAMKNNEITYLSKVSRSNSVKINDENMNFSSDENKSHTANFYSSASLNCMYEMVNNVRNNINTNNPAIKDHELIYLSKVSRSSVKINDENMNLSSDENEDSTNNDSIETASLNKFNSSVTKINSNFQPNVFLNDDTFENNVNDDLMKPQNEISAKPANVGVPRIEQLKKDISSLKKGNSVFKRKLSEVAKLKREKLHYLVKLLNSRKNVQLVRNSYN